MSFVCTGWGTYPGACFGSVFQEQAPSCVPALSLNARHLCLSKNRQLKIIFRRKLKVSITFVTQSRFKLSFLQLKTTDQR